MTIADRIRGSQGVYIVAELSANHGRKLSVALEAVEAAKESGADALKIQTYTADTLTIDSEEKSFRIGEGTIWEGRRLYELYDEASFPWEWHAPLQQRANELNINFFSTAFDATSVKYLEDLDVPIHKVASFEIVDVALVRAMAMTGKPLIISTGMATEGEIADAVQVATDSGASSIVLLKCTSAYPSPATEMNLRTIPAMRERFNVPVGLSDHTMGHVVPVAAVALGACLIEKHFTISRKLGGPDSEFSMEPAEFAKMVEAVRTTEEALGEARYGPTPHEKNSLVFRRSLFVVEDVAAGATLTESNVRAIRPGYGLAPKHLDDIVGKVARVAIARGTPLSWDLIAGSPE